MTNQEYVAAVRENTVFEDIPIGVLVSTIDKKNNQLKYAFRKEYLQDFIENLDRYININPEFKLKDIRKAFEEYIFMEYRQHVAVERVLIIGLNILILHKKLKPEGEYRFSKID